MELNEPPEDGLYRETLVSKGVVGQILDDPMIVELSRDTQTGIIGSGISEGEVRNGVKVKMGNRILDFAEKVFNRRYFLDRKSPEITLRRIVQNHAKLKELGFPVINTMRIIDVPKGQYERILMTDLTEGGKKLVISATTSEDDFQKYELTNGDEVGVGLLELYTKLNDNGVQICHYDVFFLVVDKETKKGRIVLGDISRIIFADDKADKPDKIEIEANNYENMKSFVELLNRMLKTGNVDFSLVRDHMMETA